MDELKEFYLKNEKTIMMVMIVLFACLLVFIAVALIVSVHKMRKHDKKMAAKTRKNYVLVFNFTSGMVIYFEKNNPKNQVSCKIDDFYKHVIDPRSRDIFRNWLENIFSDNHNLLSEITINLDGRNVLPLYFTIDSLDVEKRIVHVSSYSVEYLNDSMKKRRFFLASVNESKGVNIDTVFTKKSVANGLILFIRFFALDKRIDQGKQNAMLNELRQVCFLFLKEKRSRYRIEYNEDSSFVIYDTGCTSLQEMQHMTISLIKKLNSRLEIHSYQDIFNFSIGVVETKYFSDGKRCIDVALNKSYSAEHQENKFEWFTIGDNTQEYSSKIFEDELEQIINGRKREHKIRFLYQPLVQALPLKMYGFYTYIELENSVFRNVEELKPKASEYGKTEELLHIICKNFINKFYNEVAKRIIESGQENEYKLFIPISTYDKDVILKVLGEIRHTRDCNIVLVIDDVDINDEVSINYEEAISSIQALKKKKYEIALLLKDGNLTWANGVYESFDYFIVDRSLTSGEESLSSSSLIKRLSSKLLGFHRPLIALDMDNKNKIHILRDQNFTIFGGNVIEAPNENIIELTSRKMSVIRK